MSEAAEPKAFAVPWKKFDSAVEAVERAIKSTKGPELRITLELTPSTASIQLNQGIRKAEVPTQKFVENSVVCHLLQEAQSLAPVKVRYFPFQFKKGYQVKVIQQECVVLSK